MAVPAGVIERPASVAEVQARTTARSFQARRRRRQRLVHWTIFAVLIVIAAIFIFPFFWVLSSSLQTTLEANSLPLTWWPAVPQWHNYVVAWGELDFTRYLLQTVYVMVLSTVGEVLSASLCAYGFARIKFPGRDAWFYGVLASIMLPGTVTLIPLFIIFKDFGWLNTYYPLWVPAFLGGGAFNIFLMRQFMLSIPRELEESARLDGAGHLTIFRRIVLPLIRPVLAVATWTAALSSWGNFFLPLIILTSEKKWTLALGLYGLGSETVMGYADQLVMAITVVTMIPVIIGFFLLQRWLIEGVNLTGVAR
jgi:multiple sugar transport system permease protein